jgi:hypothetical protein
MAVADKDDVRFLRVLQLPGIYVNNFAGFDLYAGVPEPENFVFHKASDQFLF